MSTLICMLKTKWMNGLFSITTFTSAAASLKMYLSPHLLLVLLIYLCFTVPNETWRSLDIGAVCATRLSPKSPTWRGIWRSMPSSGRLTVMSAGRAWPPNHCWSAINSNTSTPTSFCTSKERPGCSVQRQQSLWQRPPAPLLTLHGWIARQQWRLPRGPGVSCRKVGGVRQRRGRRGPPCCPAAVRLAGVQSKNQMNLTPAVRSMFPAIICGKCAVDRSVVTLMSDRLNAVSMSKVQRLLQSRATTSGTWNVGTCTRLSCMMPTVFISERYPFVCQSSWHLHPSHRPVSTSICSGPEAILEMEKIPVYRDQILSTTGEILCIDGMIKVCIAKSSCDHMEQTDCW